MTSQNFIIVSEKMVYIHAGRCQKSTDPPDITAILVVVVHEDVTYTRSVEYRSLGTRRPSKTTQGDGTVNSYF